MSDVPPGGILLQFFIHGTPAPGGSKTFFPLWDKSGKLVTTIRNGRPWPVIRVVDDAGENNKRWKETVALQAQAYLRNFRGFQPWEGPVKAEFIFWMKRPQGHFGTGRNAQTLKASAPAHHLQKPDALKLGRSTEDALTGVVWKDDCTSTRICSEKRWCGPSDRPGCAVRIILL